MKKGKIEITPNLFSVNKNISKQKCVSVITSRDEFEQFYLRDFKKIEELTNGRIKTKIGCYVFPEGAIITEDLSGISAPIISVGNLKCECIITNYDIIVFGKIFASGIISSKTGIACYGGIFEKDVETPKLQVNLDTIIIQGEKIIKKEIIASGKNNNKAEIIWLGE